MQRTAHSGQRSEKKIKTIGIVGLGLMGGSLAAASRKLFPETRIIGISRDASAVREGISKKWIHAGGSDLKKLIPACDLVILCTPVDTLKFLLKKIDSFAKQGTPVTDVGSVKGEICAWAEKQKFHNITFVGAHPMAGSHNRGIHAAGVELYTGQLIFIIKGAKNRSAYSAVKNFWSRISGRVVETSAVRHDKIAAEISHLPHAVAACLVQSAGSGSIRFAAKGFLDSTRIAQADASIWTAIFGANRREVLKSLTVFEKKIKIFKKALAGREIARLQAILKRSSKIRRGLKR